VNHTNLDLDPLDHDPHDNQCRGSIAIEEVPAGTDHQEEIEQDHLLLQIVGILETDLRDVDQELHLEETEALHVGTTGGRDQDLRCVQEVPQEDSLLEGMTEEQDRHREETRGMISVLSYDSHLTLAIEEDPVRHLFLIATELLVLDPRFQEDHHLQAQEAHFVLALEVLPVAMTVLLQVQAPITGGAALLLQFVTPSAHPVELQVIPHVALHHQSIRNVNILHKLHSAILGHAHLHFASVLHRIVIAPHHLATALHHLVNAPHNLS